MPEDNPKKGRRAVVYGRNITEVAVDTDKLTEGVDAKKAKGAKASSDVTSEISKTNSEEDKGARETVYEKYRMEIQFHFRLIRKARLLLMLKISATPPTESR